MNLDMASNTPNRNSRLSRLNTYHKRLNLSLPKVHRSSQRSAGDDLYRIYLTTSPLSQLKSHRVEKGAGDRKEVSKLEEWLDKALQEKFSAKKRDPDELIAEVTSIYKQAFEDLIKQVTVNCKDRGKLLSKIWQAHNQLLYKSIKVQRSKDHLTIENNKNKFESKQKEYENQLLLSENTIKNLDNTVASLKSKVRHLEESLSHKKAKEEKLIKHLQMVQQHYRAIKQEIYILKEDKRILTTKLESSSYEVLHTKFGYLVPVPRSDLRSHRKSTAFLNCALSNDPILQEGIDEKLSENIEKFGNFYSEMYEQALFTEPDYKDNSVEPMLIDLTSTSTNTDVTELCGDCVGIKQRKMNMRGESLIRKKLTISEMMEMEFPGVEETKKATNDLIMKHKRVKNLLSYIINEGESLLVYENIPHSDIIKNLLKNVQLALSFVESHPFESKEISDEEQEKPELPEQNLLITHIKKRKPTELSVSAEKSVLRIAHMPIDKIKQVVTKKVLLKFIAEIYKKQTSHNTFAEKAYRLLMKQLKSPKLAQGRFEQVLGSTVKYRYITRIRLFGRFMGLFNTLTKPDFKLFMKCLRRMEALNALRVAEDAEVVLVPAKACEELVKDHSKHFTELDMREIYHKLAVLTEKQMVNCDDFLEVMVEKYSYRRNKALEFLKHIFDASDLNNDGYLEFQEFKLLLTHLANSNFSLGAAQDLFKGHAEDFLNDNDANVQAISLENLAVLNSQYMIFTIEGVNKFAQARNDQEALLLIEQVHDLDFVLREIYWRFSSCKKWENSLVHIRNILEVLKIRVTQKKDPLADWIALRLLQEESKRVLLNDKVRKIMPIISNISTIKLLSF